jgi:hypothetical protein
LQTRRWREIDSNPGFLREKATKTSEKVLIAPTQETWIGGVSTRQVDNLAGDGLSGISKSQVSKLCKQIAIVRNKSVKCEPGHTSRQGSKLLTGSEATIRVREEKSMYVKAEIDPMAMILSEPVYLRWVELKHPHVPSVAEVQQVVRTATTGEKSAMLDRAKMVAEHARVVEQAIAELSK